MSDYPSLTRTAMLVSLKDIHEAFEFVCAGGGGEHEADANRQLSIPSSHRNAVTPGLPARPS